MYKKTTMHFNYTALDNSNIQISGDISSQNKQIALLMLEKRGLTNIKLKIQKDSMLANILSKNYIMGQDIAIFARQLATMQRAGIPLMQSIKIISESTNKSVLRKLFLEIGENLENGLSFSDSLKKRPMIFDDLFCNLVAIGEQVGALDLMLDRIATYKEKAESIKLKLKKAMFYPITVLSVAFFVTAILLLKVVPTFKSMFESFDAELPIFTLIVLQLSNLINKYSYFLIVATIAPFIISYKAYRTNIKFKHFIQRKVINAPIIGKILNKTMLARFARTLATTLAAGIPLTNALEATAGSIGNIVYSEAINSANKKVSDGMQLNKALLESKLFPSLIIQMIIVGEESGSLEPLLNNAAMIYEEEVNTIVDGLSSMLEPVIMVFLGIIVGGLIISMYLPIFKLGSII